MNKRRAMAVYRDIKKHWKNYDQGSYHGRNPEVGECLSVHCVAGFCELRVLGIRKRSGVSPDKLSGPFSTKSAYEYGKEYLELTNGQANYLFDSTTRWASVSRILRTGKFPKWLEGE
jgi:hypothetical protein